MMRNFILVGSVVMILSACRNEATNDQTERNRADIQSGQVYYDSTETSIISWGFGYPFDSLVYKPASLTETDIKAVEDLLVKTIDDYNHSLSPDRNDYRIDWKARGYKKQLVAVVNLKGEKEVWVNCFCHSENDSWKDRIILVFDGGPCFFNFKLNLSKKKVYELRVNGVV